MQFSNLPQGAQLIRENVWMPIEKVEVKIESQMLTLVWYPVQHIGKSQAQKLGPSTVY